MKSRDLDLVDLVGQSSSLSIVFITAPGICRARLLHVLERESIPLKLPVPILATTRESPKYPEKHEMFITSCQGYITPSPRNLFSHSSQNTKTVIKSARHEVIIKATG